MISYNILNLEVIDIDTDVIIIGGGIAGLTAAAYLCCNGQNVLVCEKEEKAGGLVNSFIHNGYTFDGGIRAIENSGIVFPMLKQLGLDIDFVKNDVSLGIEDDIIKITSKQDLSIYSDLLLRHFPKDANSIDAIISEIKKVMKHMDVLYGIDNPMFIDLKKNMPYLIKTILPWLFKYLFTIKKIQKLDKPIQDHLRQFTNNQVLIDIIAQHFFEDTPAFFALSYFSLYLDYCYPKGGTGALIEKLKMFIIDHKGIIKTDTKICRVDPKINEVTDTNENKFRYKKLICASDIKSFYDMLFLDDFPDTKIKKDILSHKVDVSDKLGGDSVLTIYLETTLDKKFFEDICSAHFFYTPYNTGLSTVDTKYLRTKIQNGIKPDEKDMFSWLKDYLTYNTYEISFPVMRDPSLAPPGKTGAIISLLMDYSITRYIFDSGWYEKFKQMSAEMIIDILDSTIFKGIKNKTEDLTVSTPLTIERRTKNSEGAITGWAFTNSSIPAVKTMSKISHSIITPVPDVFQAGQWSYSPSGLPISILTGKLAADAVMKQLKP